MYLKYKKRRFQKMKQKSSLMFLVLALFITGIITGCASAPELGEATELQQILNALPAVPVAGKNLKFEFRGDVWISKVDGKDFSLGAFKSEDNELGSIITLTQTHLYSDKQKPGVGGDVGWVGTPGPEIVLEYIKGPPAKLSPK
jgi:hypothetical protein